MEPAALPISTPKLTQTNFLSMTRHVAWVSRPMGPGEAFLIRNRDKILTLDDPITPTVTDRRRATAEIGLTTGLPPKANQAGRLAARHGGPGWLHGLFE